MLPKEQIIVEGQIFDISFEFKKVESGLNHIVAKTVINGEQISTDDRGLGKNSALSKLREQIRLRLMKKAA